MLYHLYAEGEAQNWEKTHDLSTTTWSNWVDICKRQSQSMWRHQQKMGNIIEEENGKGKHQWYMKYIIKSCLHDETLELWFEHGKHHCWCIKQRGIHETPFIYDMQDLPMEVFNIREMVVVCLWTTGGRWVSFQWPSGNFNHHVW